MSYQSTKKVSSGAKAKIRVVAGFGSKQASGASAKTMSLAAMALAGITLAAYWPLFFCKFIDKFDDHLYITQNPFIRTGLGISSWKWAFTTYRAGNWHPLTWISHMIDFRLYGLNPMGHHLTSLLLHIASALLLFIVLHKMTGEVWKSCFVAALFAIHPLHVESVAWASERKDVLSTFFFMLTLLAYVTYTNQRGIGRYLLVMLPFALGLMAKPMLVTLPLILLLLDYWPLGRLGPQKLPFHKLLLEKLPLFVLSLASCVLTWLAQQSYQALAQLKQIPMFYRVGNAAVAYCSYLLKMLWPANLAVFYPHLTTRLPIWQAICAIAALVLATAFIIRARKNHPYLIVGWLWYLLTLIPVIGLVQVGSQSMADRYTYIPLTGCFIMLAWGLGRLPSGSRAGVAAALASVAVLAVCTNVQVRLWKDTYTLFDHAIHATADNYIAYNARGAALIDHEKYQEAADDLEKSVTICPRFTEAHVRLGFAFIELGRIDEGFQQLQMASMLGTDTEDMHHSFALGYYKTGNLDLASQECLTALQMNSTYAPAHNLLGAIMAQQGNIDGAIEHWKLAADLSPGLADPHGNLARAYFLKRDYKAAWSEIHLFEKDGKNPPSDFADALRAQMPDPGD